jgi:hypothetical protein
MNSQQNNENMKSVGVENLERVLDFYCNNEKIVFTLNKKDISTQEVMSSNHLLPALAFRSFNAFRSPFGNDFKPNEKALVEDIMPVYIDSKENDLLDCQVIFKDKAFALMVISDHLDKMKNQLKKNNDLDSVVEIEFDPFVNAFKVALENKTINKITVQEANRKGYKLS